MKYKKICIILGIILIFLAMGIIFSKIREDIALTKDIEANLNLTDKEKEELNYKNLIKDIKSVKNNNGIIKAKKIEKDSSDEMNEFVMQNIYQGEGYMITIYDGEDAYTVDFHIEDKSIYFVSIDTWFGPEDVKEQRSEKIKNFIEYGSVVIIGVLEIIFLYKYKKQARLTK